MAVAKHNQSEQDGSAEEELDFGDDGLQFEEAREKVASAIRPQ